MAQTVIIYNDPDNQLVVYELKTLEHQDIELPTGTIIDLRFSGKIDPDNNFSRMAGSRDRVILLCNEAGLPDRIMFGGQSILLDGKFSLLLRAYRDFEVPIAATPAEELRKEIAKRVFMEEDSYWVTTNASNGKTEVNAAIRPTAVENVTQMVNESKALTRN